MQDSFSERRTEQTIKLNPQHCAVLVVDMLNDFLKLDGKMVLEGGEIIFEPMRKLLEESRKMEIHKPTGI